VQFVGAPWYGRNVMKSLLGAAVVSTVALAAGPAHALSVQEAILLAKPAVALVTARVDAEITMNCGRAPAGSWTAAGGW